MDFSYLVKLIREAPQGLRLRQGKIITVNNDRTVDVQIAGDTNTLPSVRYLSNYAPLPETQTWLLTQNADILAIGMIAGVDRTLAPTAIRTTTQAIPNDTQTKVTFDSVDSDAWNCWDVGPNPTRLTAPISGRYIAMGNIAFAPAASGHRAVNILKNNTDELVRSDFPTVGNSVDTHSTVTSTPISLTKGDYIELRVWQNSGSSLNLQVGSNHEPKLGLIYLGS